MWVYGYLVKNNKGWFQTISPTGISVYTNSIREAHMFDLVEDARHEAERSSGAVHKASLLVEHYAE